MMTDKYEASIQLPNVGSNISSNSTDDLVEAYRVEVAVSLSLLVGLIQVCFLVSFCYCPITLAK